MPWLLPRYELLALPSSAFATSATAPSRSIWQNGHWLRSLRRRVHWRLGMSFRDAWHYARVLVVRPSNEINIAKDPSLSDSTTANPQNRTLCAQWERAPTGRLCMALIKGLLSWCWALAVLSHMMSDPTTRQNFVETVQNARKELSSKNLQSAGWESDGTKKKRN